MLLAGLRSDPGPVFACNRLSRNISDRSVWIKMSPVTLDWLPPRSDAGRSRRKRVETENELESQIEVIRTTISDSTRFHRVKLSMQASRMASNLLAQRLHHQDWLAATQLLFMMDLTCQLHPTFAQRLSSAGCAGILASCAYGDATPDLLSTALSLQFKVLEADDARNIDSVLNCSEYLL